MGGFLKVEKVMKHLFVRKLYLWPRFHLVISDSLEKHKIDVVELRQPMTKSMTELQIAIIEVVNACLSELRKLISIVDITELTIDNALFKSFDMIIRQQLDPIWHRLGSKTKQLVNDLKTLRKLLYYLQCYDCVTFNSFLDVVVATAQSGQHSPWLFMTATDTLLKVARARIYKQKEQFSESMPQELELVFEENPKWNSLANILKEIEKEIDSSSHSPILIMVNDDQTRIQLREYLGRRSCDAFKTSTGLRQMEKVFTTIKLQCF